MKNKNNIQFDLYVADRLYDELEQYGCIAVSGCVEGSYYVSVWSDISVKNFKKFYSKVRSIEKNVGIDIIVTEQERNLHRAKNF